MIRWLSGSFLVLLSFLLSGLGALSAAATHPNVILITLDTTRADRMGFLGSTRKLTPNLDRLAEQSVVFTHAYSQVPLTTSSHATILTGTYPQFHNVIQPGVPLAASLPYAPDILHHAGYHTAAFVGSMIMQAQNGGAPGFDRGFEEYDAGFHNPEPGGDRYGSLERRGEDVVAHALAWIGKHSSEPFFVWIHLYDPHAPYEAPEPFGSRYKSEPYDGEIAYVDAAMGKLFDELRTNKLYDGTLVALMADHGEALGEHGERGHGLLLYEPTIRVPLVIKMPGNAGKRVEARVQLVDVMPTVMEAVGVAIPKEVQGKSLAPLMNGGAAEDQPAYAETDYPRGAFGWSPLRSWRAGKYMYVQAPRPELYDEITDPGEDHNLATTSPAIGQTLGGQLVAFREKTRSASGPMGFELSAQQTKSLQALGYVAATSHNDPTKVQGVDPKDKVEISNQMTDVNFLMEQAKYSEAVPLLKSVVEKDPTVVSAYQVMANAYVQLGDEANAIAALKKLVELAPGAAPAHYELAMMLLDRRDLKGAEPELEKAVAGMPDSAQARYELARLYVNTLRLDDAVKMAKEALKIQPGYYDANLLLGFVYVNQKNPTAALPYLQEASETRPKSPRPHEFLAQAYAALGSDAKAQQEQAIAEQLKQRPNQ